MDRYICRPPRQGPSHAAAKASDAGIRGHYRRPRELLHCRTPRVIPGRRGLLHPTQSGELVEELAECFERSRGRFSECVSGGGAREEVVSEACHPVFRAVSCYLLMMRCISMDEELVKLILFFCRQEEKWGPMTEGELQ